MVHPDVIYNADIVKYFLTALINDSLAIRKIALKVVLFSFLQSKPKFKKIEKDPYSYSAQPDKVTPGIRSDNKWLLYNSKTVPLDAKQWEETRYVHDQFTGFYTWPKKLELHAPWSEQPNYEQRKDKLTPQEKVIYDFFTNSNNINALIKYWSLEEKKGRDQFNVHKFYLIKVSGARAS